uniref:Disease resistance N-terminal domain-containing protein n=1 Tax=Triticum urartu TaxID=4572 RepID=A0A8R7R9C1_TRIUA
MEMVVGASEATMKSLLSKLGGLLAHEYALIRGVRGDIQYINDEMASMQAFLVDLAPRGHDSRMKDWMKQIRDVTYDIEDCVDDFAHHLPHDPAAPPRPRPRSPLPLPRLRRLRDLDLLAPLQHRLRHRRAQGPGAADRGAPDQGRRGEPQDLGGRVRRSSPQIRGRRVPAHHPLRSLAQRSPSEWKRR